MGSVRLIRLLVTSLWLGAMVQGARAGEPAGIGVQPVSFTAPEGCMAFFNVGVTGMPPISLQWFRDDLPLPGATNASFTFRAFSPADNGARFRVSVSNAFGGVLSAEVVLTVTMDIVPPVLVETGGDATRTRVFVRFGGGACGGLGMEPMSAENPSNYSLSGGLVVFNAALDSSGTLVTLTTSPQTPGELYALTPQNIQDKRGNLIVPGWTTTFRARVSHPQALLFEAFRRPGCGELPCTFFEWTTNLQTEAFLSAFDTRQVYPDDSQGSYTARVSGFFVPPVSGNWIFCLSSEDDSRLYLGTNGLDPNGVRLIVHEPGCCQPFSANQSPPIHLRANQPYYIEGLYREQIGGDYLQVAAKLESDPTEPDSLQPIPSEYFLPSVEWPTGLISIQSQPQGLTVLLGESATLAVTATAPTLNPDFPFPVLHYQWQRQRLVPDLGDWVDIPEATNATHTTPPRLNCDPERFRCLLYSAGASVLSAQVFVSVVVDLSPPMLQNVFAGPSLEEVHVVFNQPVTPDSGGDPFNYAIDGLKIIEASMEGPARARLRTTRQKPGTLYSLVVNGARQFGEPPCGGEEIPPNTTATFQAWELVRGAARREVYLEIPGTTIQALRDNSKFPNAPDRADYVHALDGGTDRLGLDLADNYGMRISGYLTPLLSHNYDFYVTSDDQSEFWLSLDEDPAHLRLICLETSRNTWRQWAGPIPNPPNPPDSWSRARFPKGISLSAANAYYFEALMKEAAGTDHLGVAWTPAGALVPASGTPPIEGEFLAVVAPRIDVRRSGDSLVISWTLGGILESAPALDGPWTPEPLGSNPRTVPLPASPQFYRSVFVR